MVKNLIESIKQSRGAFVTANIVSSSVAGQARPGACLSSFLILADRVP